MALRFSTANISRQAAKRIGHISILMLTELGRVGLLALLSLPHLTQERMMHGMLRVTGGYGIIHKNTTMVAAQFTLLLQSRAMSQISGVLIQNVVQIWIPPLTPPCPPWR